MTARTWLITGVSSGFGRELTSRLLDRGDRVIGTVRDTSKIADLTDRYPDTFVPEMLEMTDSAAVRRLVDRAFEQVGRIDVIVSNGLWPVRRRRGTVRRTGRAHHRHQPDRPCHADPRSPAPPAQPRRRPRIIQISSYGGQVAFPGNSLYHATKWGIEGFCESVAAEVAPFGIGVTIVEPGGARTEFRYGSARVADLMPEYDNTPAHAFQRMLDPANGLAPGDRARMAARIIDSVDSEPAPLRMMLGSQALQSTISTLRQRIDDFEQQTDLAASTDFPPQ